MKDAAEELRPAYSKAAKILEATLDEKRPITDLTKTALLTVGHYTKLRGAQAHEITNELMREKLSLQRLALKREELP